MFLAEEQNQQKRQHEFEKAEEVKREQSLFEEISEQAKEETQVSFLYNIPNQLRQSMIAKNPEQSQKTLSTLLAPPPPVPLDENGDDEQVRAFRAKLASYRTNLTPQAKEVLIGETVLYDDDNSREETLATTKGYHKRVEDMTMSGTLYREQTSLERAVGKRQHTAITHEEQLARHPQLKNAPVEGAFVKSSNTQLKYKPFNDVIRNVRCLRCGQWGHQSGDRECSLFHFNPLDHARQLREDPMTAIIQHDKMPSSTHYEEYRAGMVFEEDPEEAFLNSLSRREKKLLLRKLQALEEKNGKMPSHKASKSSKRKRRHKKKSQKKRRRGNDDAEPSSSSSTSSSSSQSSAKGQK